MATTACPVLGPECRQSVFTGPQGQATWLSAFYLRGPTVGSFMAPSVGNRSAAHSGHWPTRSAARPPPPCGAQALTAGRPVCLQGTATTPTSSRPTRSRATTGPSRSPRSTTMRVVRSSHGGRWAAGGQPASLTSSRRHRMCQEGQLCGPRWLLGAGGQAVPGPCAPGVFMTRDGWPCGDHGVQTVFCDKAMCAEWPPNARCAKRPKEEAGRPACRGGARSRGFVQRGCWAAAGCVPIDGGNSPRVSSAPQGAHSTASSRPGTSRAQPSRRPGTSSSTPTSRATRASSQATVRGRRPHAPTAAPAPAHACRPCASEQHQESGKWGEETCRYLVPWRGPAVTLRS